MLFTPTFFSSPKKTLRWVNHESEIMVTTKFIHGKLTFDFITDYNLIDRKFGLALKFLNECKTEKLIPSVNVAMHTFHVVRVFLSLLFQIQLTRPTYSFQLSCHGSTKYKAWSYFINLNWLKHLSIQVSRHTGKIVVRWGKLEQYER